MNVSFKLLEKVMQYRHIRNRSTVEKEVGQQGHSIKVVLFTNVVI